MTSSIQELLAKINSSNPTALASSESPILLVLAPSDAAFASRLKPLLGTTPATAITKQSITTTSEVTTYAKAKGVYRIVTSHPDFVRLLSQNKKASLSNFAGSLFFQEGCEILVIESPQRLIDTPYAPFLFKRHLSKFTALEDWQAKFTSPFRWHHIEDSASLEPFAIKASDAALIAIDIETIREPLAIQEVGFCFIWKDGTSDSLVITLKEFSQIPWIRMICASSAPKVFQNGKYDLAYLTSWGIIVSNYFWDTATAQHCWLAELPKDLASLGAFYLREAMYWKDMAASDDKYLRKQYNARDTWTTAIVAINQMFEIPSWAWDNFQLEFPLLFPCHLVEMQGIKRDMARRQEAETRLESEISADLASLQTMVGNPNFNPNSPAQVQSLLKALGCAKLADRDGKLSSDEKTLAKAILMHPLNQRVLSKILDIRGKRKMVSTYLGAGKEYKGQILFSMNPHGTDTGRMASKEHHFWCGLQIQNIPNAQSDPEKTVKQTLIAPEGWMLAENDLSKAESWGTGYISGDAHLIEAVNSPLDFHKFNASKFFGVPYEQVSKALRQLAKPVNHGANYNMGPAVLVNTMGTDKILEARELLKLPKFWSPIQVAEHLLAAFHRTYPGIRNNYYKGAVQEIKLTGKLTSKIKNRLPWTRRCFGDPEIKSWLNAYVAHCPQSLNAMNLNQAFMRIFYDLAIHPDHRDNFKVIAQIHDSVLYRFKEGMHEFYTEAVRQRMEIPVEIEAYDGVTRTYICPADIKAGPEGKGVHRWSETE